MKKYAIGILITLIMITGLSWLLNADYRQSTVEQGIVIEKAYQPSSTSIGTGLTTNGDLVTTTNYQGENYILLVKGKNLNGEMVIVEVEVSSWKYFEYEIGDKYFK